MNRLQVKISLGSFYKDVSWLNIPNDKVIKQEYGERVSKRQLLRNLILRAIVHVQHIGQKNRLPMNDFVFMQVLQGSQHLLYDDRHFRARQDPSLAKPSKVTRAQLHDEICDSMFLFVQTAEIGDNVLVGIFLQDCVLSLNISLSIL